MKEKLKSLKDKYVFLVYENKGYYKEMTGIVRYISNHNIIFDVNGTQSERFIKISKVKDIEATELKN